MSATHAPKPWKYILMALAALLILIPLWMVFTSLVIQPEYTSNPEVGMANRLMWWLIAPITAVVLVTGWRWHVASSQNASGGGSPATTTAPGSRAVPVLDEKPRQEYVLEVIGLGITLDKYRQGKLWDALQQGHPYASIREQDPKKYPWAAQDKQGQEGGRQGSSLENGASKLPLYWGIPVLNGEPPAHNKTYVESPSNPAIGFAGSAEASGMAWHLFVTAKAYQSEVPDKLIQDAFDFFDDHPDVPFIVVTSNDGDGTRDDFLPEGSESIVKDGYYVPFMPDSSALFVLARRERAEAIKAHAFDDLDEASTPDMSEVNRRSVGRRVFLAYSRLSKKLGAAGGGGGLQRNPTVAEWLAESANLAKSADFYPQETFSTYAEKFKHPLGGGVVHAPKDFKPTPWFPVPWSKWQLGMFEALPTLGYLHRPTYIKLTDEEGKPLQRRDERVKALTTGWQQALLTLPEAQRKTALKRIITATGGNTDKTIALTSMINAQAEAGGPELDASKTSQWINTDARLGNTGAATWFVQMGIGVMGSYIDGGVSAAINMRDDKEASVIFISPPPADKIKKQGAAVFKNNTKPAIDPANYEQ